MDLKESQYKLEKINATIEKNEAIYQTDKKKELEGIESDIAYKDEKIGELEASIQGLSDKAKSEEERANKAMRKAKIAEQVYDMMMVNPNDAKYEMQERIIELTYENEQLKKENKTLRGKLQQAYDYMKQFVINGRNMLEDFWEKTGQVIQAIQNVFRRGA